MKVKQFRYAQDNLGYVLHLDRIAIAIDGGAVEEILLYLQENDLELSMITNTHAHPDHTMGTRELIGKTGATFLSNETIRKRGVIEIENERLKVYHTPGHTADSVCFHPGNVLISGDTLFNGKAGRCFSGDLKGFYNSIKMIMGFPGETIIYAGHDYVEEYMALAKKLEPDNTYIDVFLKKYSPIHVFSTLDEEMKINPCLRFNDKKMVSIMRKKGFPVETEYDRWKAIMHIVQED